MGYWRTPPGVGTPLAAGLLADQWMGGGAHPVSQKGKYVHECVQGGVLWGCECNTWKHALLWHVEAPGLWRLCSEHWCWHLWGGHGCFFHRPVRFPCALILELEGGEIIRERLDALHNLLKVHVPLVDRGVLCVHLFPLFFLPLLFFMTLLSHLVSGAVAWLRSGDVLVISCCGWRPSDPSHC